MGEGRDRLLVRSGWLLGRSAIRKLRAIEHTVLALSGDVRLVTADLLRQDQLGPYLISEIPGFWSMDTRFHGGLTFGEVLLDGIRTRAAEVRSGEAELRDLLGVEAATKSAIASIRLQRWVTAWTVVLAVLTGVLVWLALNTSTRAGH
jgi:hypothetical protein